MYERGLARLIHHKIDHLDGLQCTARMRTGVDSIPVEEYRQTGRPGHTSRTEPPPAGTAMRSRGHVGVPTTWTPTS
ncbi:hypothetical protein ACFXOS_24875 [Streptomyces sp. NPDC059175]|uniref:hypothetical protein n=1 Tax=Streptomyces sp. NPDC059175 TaxID=3346757 RepID=UPI0036B4DD9F